MKIRNRLSIRLPLFLAISSIVLAVAITPARAAQSQVASALDQVPAKSQVVIVVPNLKTLSDHLTQWKQATGIPAPMLDNLLGTIKNKLNISAGLDDTGSLMVVIPDIQTTFANREAPGTLFFVPVTNYGKLIKGLDPNAAANGGITSMQLPNGKHAYARQVGNYAVFSPNKSAVKNDAPGHQAATMMKQAGAVGAKALKTGDMAVYLDLEAMSPKAVPMIDQSLAKMAAQLAASRATMNPRQARQAADAEAIMKLYGEAAKAVFRQSTAMVSTVDIKSQGLAISNVLQAKPNTPIARLFPGGSGKLTGQLMKLLPRAPYLFAVSDDFKAVDIPSLVKLLTTHVPAKNPLAPMLQMIQQNTMGMMKLANGSAGIFLTPTPQSMTSGGLMRGINIYDTSNGKAFLAKNKAYLKALDGTSFTLMPAGKNKPAQKMSFSTHYTPKAVTVKGQAADHYQIKMNLPATAAQHMSPMAMMLGGTGYSGYITALGNDVVQTTAADKDLLKQGMTAVKQKQGLGTNAEIKSLRQQLPDHLAAESYLSVAGVMKTANLFIPMLGVPPIKVQSNVPPLALGIGINQNAIQSTLFVPNDATLFVVNSGKQIMPILRRYAPAQHSHKQSHNNQSAPY